MEDGDPRRRWVRKGLASWEMNGFLGCRENTREWGRFTTALVNQDQVQFLSTSLTESRERRNKNCL